MRHVLLLLAGIVLVSGAAWAQAPQVTQVSAQQFGSFVRIEYDLSGPADTPIAVSLAASNDGGQLFSLPLSTVHGDVGVHLSPGTGKVAIWDTGTDLPDSVNPDVRIWVKAWIPNAAPVALDNTDFVFVYADGPDTGGTVRETQLPGFYVTPCVVSTAVDAPSIPQALANAFPDYAFEVFQDTVAGDTWDNVRTRTPWADAPTLTCTEATGWRIAAYYWPTEVSAPVTPDLSVRPFALANGAASSASFTLDTTTSLRDLDADGVPDDKTDRDQDFVLDVLADFNGNGVADAFEDANHDQVADGYGAVGTGEAALIGYGDANENQLPDYFESRYPITSSTHPRGDRVYFNGSFAAVINDYLPGAAGYRWRIADEETVTLEASDNALNGAGPHAITTEPGDGVHYLHVAAVDNGDAIVPGSERRFVFNTSLQAPTVSSETHPAPGNESTRPVFAARIEVGYGPKQWRSEAGTVDSMHQLLVFQNQLWTLNARDGIWRSKDGVSREAAQSKVPWPGATNLSAVVFRGQMWVHGTFEYWDWDYQVWSSSDGRDWQQHRGIPWQQRTAPKLVVFRDALYAFGGTGYNVVKSPVWRSLDGETWTEITPDVAWPVQEDPNIFVYGDSLWLNPRAEGAPTGGLQPGAWRSWDGVTWVPAEPATTTKADAEGEPDPSETDWLGWNNVTWRYGFYPWSGVFTAFQESLWLAGLSPWNPSETTGNDSYWWFNAQHAFALATTQVSPPMPNDAAAISYRGRLHLIGRDSYYSVHSEFVDDWYISSLSGIQGTALQLIHFDGALWSYGAANYRVRRVGDTGSVTDMYESVHVGGKFIAFQNALWLFGGRNAMNALLATAETSSDGTHWITTGALPWGPRRDMGMAVLDGALWMAGGTGPSTKYKDVWRSEDGVTWTRVLEAGPWQSMNDRTMTAYDGALWFYDQRARAFWRSTDGVDWSLEESGIGSETATNAVAVHQDCLFAISYSDGYIVRRHGRAIAPLDSLEGIRYHIDQLPNTDPTTGEPLTPRTFLESEPLPPGNYWLHLAAVDSLGQAGTVVHRPFTVEAPLPPVIYNGSLEDLIDLHSNQFEFIVYDPSMGRFGEQLFFGLNTAPGGTADTPAGLGFSSLPCVPAGTYWLLATSVNMYGTESRAEQMITVTDPVELPGPGLRFDGEAQYAEERLPHLPGDPVDVLVTPAAYSDGPIRYLMDERRVADTDFSGGLEAPLPSFTVEPGIGRHFVHTHLLDNCELPTAESVRSILVRKRFAPELHLGAGTTESSIEIVWPAAESNEGGYHYVVDSQPDTVLTADDPFTTDTRFTLPMPSGTWQRYVHVCTADANGDLSDTGHLKLTGEAERFFALGGPRITQNGLNPYISQGYYTIAEFYVSAPLGNPIAVDANLVSVLPNADNALVVVKPPAEGSNEVVVDVVLKREGAVAIALQEGCITDNTGAFQAVLTSLEGIVDKVAPEIQVVPTTPGEDPEAPLVFTVTAPGAEDLFLTNSVLVLERYPDERMTLAPKLLFENGVWQVIYPGVANQGAMRFSVLRNAPIALVPDPYQCTAYDRAGNCAGPITTPWVDTGDGGPVATVTVYSGPFITTYAQIGVQWNEPAYQVMNSAAIELISDPPGAVTANMSVHTNSSLEGYFEVHLQDITGDGTIQIRIPAGFAQDLQSKPSVEAISASRIVDNTKPVIAIGAPTLPSDLGGPISFPVSISGASTIGTPDVTLLKTGDVAGTMTVGTPVETAGEWHYDVQFSEYTGNGTVGISVYGVKVKDPAGNYAPEAKSALVPVALYTLTVTANAGGTVEPAPGTYPYVPGTSVAFSAQADLGSRFSYWRINSSNYSSTTITRSIDSNMTVQAVFDAEALHSADTSGNHRIELTELLRVIQFYNLGGLRCRPSGTPSEDGYVPGSGGSHSCGHHDADYNPVDWKISVTELLRLIQIYNNGNYYACPTGEDLYCLGTIP